MNPSQRHINPEEWRGQQYSAEGYPSSPVYSSQLVYPYDSQDPSGRAHNYPDGYYGYGDQGSNQVPSGHPTHYSIHHHHGSSSQHNYSAHIIPQDSYTDSRFSHSHSGPQSLHSPQYHSQSQSYQYSRPRSHSYAADPYAPMPSPGASHNYPGQIPLSPSSPTSPHYAMSSNRPFSCELCSLSFHRQHDLKRHRDTHNGDKPFLCNGGCGKTFTRKDALKRHQLVKGCGSMDDG